MKKILSAFSALMLAFPFALVAQENPVVVELYTSQGCSSCPPADKILAELAERDDVIALALHVDYWDYIGWKDPFGDPAHAVRQRAYAVAGNRRSVYTPEMIVGGVTDIVGAKPMALSKALAEHAQLPDRVALDLTRSGGKLIIAARALAAIQKPLTVNMLRYAPKQTTRIKKGENKGKTLDYANIVEGWTVLGTWDGSQPLEMTATVGGDKPIVVILQQDGMGPIIAAARLR